jgi:hypothetical protein
VKKSLFLILLISTLPKVQAQMWEVGAGVGGMNYKGDVMPKFKPLVVGPGANIFARMNWSRSLSLKANGLIGQVRGNDKAMSDPFHLEREYSFNSFIMEAGGQIEYNFMNFRTNASRIINNWTPYVFGGGAYTIYQYKAQRIDITRDAALNKIKTPVTYTQGNRRNSWILGIGFKKELNARWNWGMEFGTRWINDDLLDGLGYDSKGEYDTRTTSGPPPIYDQILLNEKKRQVPGTKAKDMYYYTNISISYLFYKVHCPPRR